MKAVANVGNQGLDEHISKNNDVLTWRTIYAKGFLGEPLSKTMKQLRLNRIQLTNQTELLHWIISPEDAVVLVVIPKKYKTAYESVWFYWI